MMWDEAELRAFAPADRSGLVDLWERCELVRSWNHPGLDIDRKLAVDPEHLLVVSLRGRIVGSVMVGYEGHRGWVNYLAVDPDLRGHGFGRHLMEAAERVLADLGCPKVNLQVRGGNDAALAFYRALGYDVDDAVSLGKRLVVDPHR